MPASAIGPRVVSLQALGFRNLDPFAAQLGDAVTVVHGPNGAGKTNLIEALYFAFTGRSPRGAPDRELIAFGAESARSEVAVQTEAGPRRFAAAVLRGEGKRLQVDGATRPTAAGLDERPAFSVFLPERLELVKGGPRHRRGHIDLFVAARWPARADLRSRYGRALAQRNALVARSGGGGGEWDVWEQELSAAAVDLAGTRAEAVEALSEPLRELGERLGLPARLSLRHQSSVGSMTAEQVAAELRNRRPRDAARGFTTLGPHRDEIDLRLDDRSLRSYGSQGQQRMGLLALLLSERRLLAETAGSPPVLLLDDVLSELDPDRRRLLVGEVADNGQCVLTTTERSMVPDADVHAAIAVDGGAVRTFEEAA
ncbi:MAG: DNA replication/repair protein RecF [Solirubrobacterales bacterium]